MVYLYLLLSTICSLAIAHLLKVTEVKGLRTLNTLTANYLFASIIALGVGFLDGNSTNSLSQPGYLIFFCIIAGTLFIGNFVVYSKSVHANGVGITIAAMRLSLLIPVLISVILYAEYLNSRKFIAIFLVFGSLLLLVPVRTKGTIGNIYASWLLIITFLLSGFADASLKIYNEEFSTNINESLFMSIVLAGAFSIGLILSLSRKDPLIIKEELVLGAAIGIANLYSSLFLIYALQGISGSVAFPIVNTLNVMGGTLLGLFVWGDTVSRKQWLGIATAILAIILLVR